MEVEGRISLLKCSWKVSFTVSYCFSCLWPCQLVIQKNQKTNWRTEVCSKYSGGYDLSCQWSEIPAQVQAPRQTKESDYSLRGSYGLCCQLTRCLREFLQLLMGNTAPYGKPWRFHTRIFFTQQVTKLLGRTAGRLDSSMFCMPTGIRCFPPLTETQQRLSNWSAEGSRTLLW